MSFKGNEVNAAAAALFTTEVARNQTGLLSQQYPTLNMNDAYRIQDELVKQKLAANRHIVGWK